VQEVPLLSTWHPEGIDSSVDLESRQADLDEDLVVAELEEFEAALPSHFLLPGWTSLVHHSTCLQVDVVP
jgi:hypothetical protein